MHKQIISSMHDAMLTLRMHHMLAEPQGVMLIFCTWICIIQGIRFAFMFANKGRMTIGHVHQCERYRNMKNPSAKKKKKTLDISRSQHLHLTQTCFLYRYISLTSALTGKPESKTRRQ